MKLLVTNSEKIYIRAHLSIHLDK